MSSGPVHNGGAFFLANGAATEVRRRTCGVAAGGRRWKRRRSGPNAYAHAVMGGFHIVPPLTDEYIRQVIAAFKEINPDYLIPGHCAGERFYDLVRAEMPDKVIRSAVGARFVFGA